MSKENSWVKSSVSSDTESMDAAVSAEESRLREILEKDTYDTGRAMDALLKFIAPSDGDK